jgi:hypothetical protein
VKLPNWLDSVWHALGGFAFGLGLGYAIPGYLDWRVSLIAFGVASFAGLGREMWQHRKDWPVLNLHRVVEGLAWGLGAALGGLL